MASPILPRDLVPGTPLADADIIFDNGSQVLRANPLGVVNAATPLASQSEAEAGTDNTKRVTALRVAQANQAQIMTPLASNDGPSFVGFDPDADYADGTAGGQIMDRQIRPAARLKPIGGSAWPFMDITCEWTQYGTQISPISPDAGSDFTTPFMRMLCLGDGHLGGAQTGLFMLDVRGLADAAQTNWNYVALQTNAAGVTSVGGTDPSSFLTSDGALFGFASHAILYPGATAWLNLTGAEIDVVAQAGSSVFYRSGVQICEVNGSTVQGTVYDAALSFGSAPGSVGWKSGILFSAVHGQNAVVSTGALMETRDGGSYAHGINLTSATFANNAFSSTGFAVNGVGDVTGRLFSSPLTNGAVRLGNPVASNAPSVQFRSSGVTADAYDSMLSAFGGDGVQGNGSLAVDCGTFQPLQNNHASLGGASNKWTEVFASTGTINTSDLTQKTVLGALSDPEFSAVLDAVGEVSLLAFQFNDAIDKKGANGARIHAGIGAQEVHAAFERHGVDPFKWAVLCRDPDFETVEEEYEAERSVRMITTTSDYETVIENGVPVRRLVTTKAEHDAFEDRVVVDENGDPVMLPEFPERRRADPDTGKVTVIPATASAPLTHPVPLMEAYTATRAVTRRRKDDNGDDAWIWGVRYEEFLVLRQAWLERG